MPSTFKLDFLPTWVDLQISLEVTLPSNIMFSTLWDNNKKALHPDLLDRLIAHVEKQLNNHLGSLKDEDVARICYALSQ